MDSWISVVLLFVISKLDLSDAIQCYSCKATGVNELDANIKCLENAYLENCAEFYHYYNDIEGQTLPGDEYYYYDAPVQGQGQGQGRGKGQAAKGQVVGAGVQGQGRVRIADGAVVQGVRPAGGAAGAGGATAVRPRRKRASRSKDKSNENEASKDNKKSGDKKKSDKSEDYEYEYEYEYYDDDDDGLDFNAKNKSGFLKPGETAEDVKDDHYCYNTAVKSGWESYTIEKGCKRIAYCKSSLAKKPEWGNPWNFCCSKSRCNVKLVKDKPQRVFGMGCRRTDDCIQGHTSRPICPAFFKTCPRLSNSLVKMECRSQARTMASIKKGGKYRSLFREKKCYCTQGYYPKGPICTSAADSISLSFFIGLSAQFLFVLYLS